MSKLEELKELYSRQLFREFDLKQTTKWLNFLHNAEYTTRHIANMEVLDLSGLRRRRIVDIPRIYMPRLKKLILSRSVLMSFRNQYLPSLEELDLSNARLYHFTNNNFPKLKKLNLSKTKIKKLSGLDFPELECLYAIIWQLKEFRGNKLPKLQVLNLYNCQRVAFDFEEYKHFKNNLEFFGVPDKVVFKVNKNDLQ